MCGMRIQMQINLNFNTDLLLSIMSIKYTSNTAKKSQSVDRILYLLRNDNGELVRLNDR